MLIGILVGITVFAHLILPPVALLWIYRSKTDNRSHWFSIVALAGSYLFLMWKGGAGWGWFGLYWPILFLISFATVTLISYPKRKTLRWFPKKKWKSWASLLTLTSIAILFMLGMPSIFTARSYPTERSVQLLFPLKGGTFHIGQGGSNETMNHHFSVTAQKYALDIQKLNCFGIRANGLMPNNLDAYAIFGSDVIAPCSGEVIGSESTLEDLTPPKGDKDNLLGNHIILFCSGTSVLLAHLKYNSVRIKIGDLVEKGIVIAQVGNSGNTSEPHLHIHAVAGRHSKRTEIASTADGVPMTFDGQFFIRNDQFRRP